MHGNRVRGAGRAGASESLSLQAFSTAGRARRRDAPAETPFPRSPTRGDGLNCGVLGARAGAAEASSQTMHRPRAAAGRREGGGRR